MKKVLPFILILLVIGGCKDGAPPLPLAESIPPLSSSAPNNNIDESNSALAVPATISTQIANSVTIESISCTYYIEQNRIAFDNVDVLYPQVKGFYDADKQERINDLIINDLLCGKINIGVLEEKRERDAGREESYNLELSYEVFMQTDQLLSVLFTGTERFTSSHFAIDSVYAIVINLEDEAILSVVDFVLIDDALFEKMKTPNNVMNCAVREGMAKETLYKILEHLFAEDNDISRELLQEELNNSRCFAVTQSSLWIVFTTAIDHASGDFLAVEVPYEY
jgi:hypothetical protein